VITLTRDHARRFLVRRHLLDPPRSLPAHEGSVLEVVQRLGSLQFDPLEYPGARNHDLALHARIQGYQRAWCDRWLYAAPAERRLFEAYNKSLNILPASELPYYRLTWERASARYEGGIFKDRPRAVRTVLDRIRAEGPLSTASFKEMKEAVAWHWAPTAEGRAVLEALFEAGQVAIARRDRSRRTYDLTERLFPPDLLARRVTAESAMRHRLLSRYRGVGLMGAGAASELTHGSGTAAERAGILAGLVADGTLLPVEVEGVRGTRYVLAEERSILDATAKPPRARRPRAVTFIAPLDPLLWDRRLLRAVFEFDYIWEVYVPEAKRLHGYYVLPILFGDRLVGRIEPRFDRRRAALEIVGIAFEPGFAAREEPSFLDALGDALDALRGFVGAERVIHARRREVKAVAAALAARAPARERARRA
jgi:hypothetical protein